MNEKIWFLFSLIWSAFLICTGLLENALSKGDGPYYINLALILLAVVAARFLHEQEQETYPYGRFE